MTPYSAELHKEITGRNPPKPFAEKTPAEQERDWTRFLASVKEAEISDETVDEFFRAARMNPILQVPSLDTEEAETA